MCMRECKGGGERSGLTYFYSNPKTILGFLYSVLQMLCSEQLQQTMHNYREIHENIKMNTFTCTKQPPKNKTGCSKLLDL